MERYQTSRYSTPCATTFEHHRSTQSHTPRRTQSVWRPHPAAFVKRRQGVKEVGKRRAKYWRVSSLMCRHVSVKSSYSRYRSRLRCIFPCTASHPESTAQARKFRSSMVIAIERNKSCEYKDMHGVCLFVPPYLADWWFYTINSYGYQYHFRNRGIRDNGHRPIIGRVHACLQSYAYTSIIAVVCC